MPLILNNLTSANQMRTTRATERKYQKNKCSGKNNEKEFMKRSEKMKILKIFIMRKETNENNIAEILFLMCGVDKLSIKRR